MKIRSKREKPAPLRTLYNVLYRSDFRAFAYSAFCILNPDEEFIPNWHIDVMCHATTETLEKTEDRLLICNVPPRSLKSFIFSIALPAFLLGLRPANKIIAVSYGETLAKHFSRETRRLMETPFYRQLFPKTRLNPRKCTESELETTAGGYRIATSVGGTLTGRGADFIILDDLIKAQDGESEAIRATCNDWFMRTAITRQNRLSKAAIFLVMQRVHEDDLSGRLIKEGWPLLKIPLIATETCSYRTGPNSTYERPEGEILQPKRDTLASVEKVRRNTTSRIFSAQYQQEPLPADGNMLKATWFKSRDRVFEREEFNRVVISCDPAAKPGENNNFTALIAFGVTNKNIHVLDVRRGHWTVVGMAEQIRLMAEYWHTDTILVEETAAGPAVIQWLQDETKLRPIGCIPKGSKEERLLGCSGRIEGGRLYLPKEAPWLSDFLREILAFPNGTNDDQIDAMTQFLEWFANNDYADISGIRLHYTCGQPRTTPFDYI